jgi:colanic acid/amylovoran biosynthesis glycosyltransferase
MRIIYLINQYPKVSHSFIRREIEALEKAGVQILRVSIRKSAEGLVDPADQKELSSTKVILQANGLILAKSILQILTNPFKLLSSLAVALAMGWHSERGVLRHLIYLLEAAVLKFWSSQEQIDHIHAHFGTNPATVALLCHQLGGPSYSFTVHGPEEFDKVVDIALPEKIKHALFVVAISSYGKSQLYRWSELKDWSKIAVVHCGLGDQFWSDSPRPIQDTPKLVSVGRLAPQKGQLLLIEAIYQLKLKGVFCELILVGDGPMRSEIEALISKYQLVEQIKITGWASEAQVKQYILESRCLVLPSFAEGLPVVLMEALALRRPVISTYIAGIPELVKPDYSGFLVPAGDSVALAEAIQKVLTLPLEELTEMGQRGYLDVLREHNITTEAKKLVELFSKQTTSLE